MAHSPDKGGAERAPDYNAFMAGAQRAVNMVRPGFNGEMGDVHADDYGSDRGAPTAFTASDGTVYVRAKMDGSQPVPVDIDEARQLAHEGKIVLTPDLARRFLMLSDPKKDNNSSEFQPKLLVDYMVLGKDHREATGARAFYGNHRHDYIPVDNLAQAAATTPNSTTARGRDLFSGETELPLTAREYMARSQELVDRVLGATLEQGREVAARAIVRAVRDSVQGIDAAELEGVLEGYRDRLREATKAELLSENLAGTRGREEAENVRSRLIQSALQLARTNTQKYGLDEIRPYTFDQVLACVPEEDMVLALEQIPNPYFRVVKTRRGLILRVTSGRSAPDTLGMSYAEAQAYAEKKNLHLSAGEDVRFNGKIEADAWIQGGLASELTASPNYYHPEIGAHLCKDLPMDTSKLGLLARGKTGFLNMLRSKE